MKLWAGGYRTALSPYILDYYFKLNLRPFLKYEARTPVVFCRGFAIFKKSFKL